MTRRFGALAAVLVAIAACTSSTPAGGSATPDPSIAFCAALETYRQTLVAVDALTPTASVDDYKKAVDDAKTAEAAVVAVSGPYAGAQLFTLQQAHDALTGAVIHLPAGTTPAQAEATLEPLLKTLIGHVVGVENAQCPTRLNPSPSFK
jgi:ABC-type glycerol-3-phosphate transport system substrate-binding protein